MNNYILFLLLIILLILICIISRYNQNNTEKFTQDFFKFRNYKYLLGCSTYITQNDKEFIYRLFSYLPTIVNINVVQNNINAENRLSLLDSNELQLMIIESNTIYNIQNNEQYKALDNIKYIMTMYDIPFNMITTQLQLYDINDIRNSKTYIRINVGEKNSPEYLTYLNLADYYNLSTNTNIILSYYNNDEAYDRYGTDIDIILHYGTHPDDFIHKLTSKIESRMIKLSSISDGNSYVHTIKEQQFYNQYPCYNECVLYKYMLTQYYPFLYIHDTPLEDNINTISINYYILANKKVSDTIIQKWISTIKHNLPNINDFEWMHYKLLMNDLLSFRMPLSI